MDERILESLRDNPLFSAFRDDDAALAQVAALMTTRRVPAGHDLVREGETGDEAYILLRGEVEVSKLTLENERYTVAVLRHHDHPVFGELALLESDRRTATIHAVNDCEVATFSRAAFDRLSAEQPALALPILRELARNVARRMRGTNDDVVLLFEALVNEIRSEAIE